jgi:hypothetical protein
MLSPQFDFCKIAPLRSWSNDATMRRRESHSATSYGPLECLEDRIMPRGRVPVLFRAEDPSLAPYAEQLAAFKAEKGVGPHDTLQVVFAFDA